MIYKIRVLVLLFFFLLLFFFFFSLFHFVWDLVSRGFQIGKFPHLGLNYDRLGHFHQLLSSSLQSILLQSFFIPLPKLSVVLA